MSSYYHVPWFTVPRKYKDLGVEDFVTDHVTDTSEDQSILSDMPAFVKSMEQASSGGAKLKRDDQDRNDTFMDSIAPVAKEGMTKDDGPKKKKVKKDDDEEFRQMAELYKEHHKKKIDDLKDYLRFSHAPRRVFSQNSCMVKSIVGTGKSLRARKILFYSK